MNTFFFKFTKCASVHCRLCWYLWRVPITYFFCVMLSNSHVIQNSIIIHRVFHKTALEIWYWIIHNIAKFPGRYSQLCWSCLIQLFGVVHPESKPVGFSLCWNPYKRCIVFRLDDRIWINLPTPILILPTHLMTFQSKAKENELQVFPNKCLKFECIFWGQYWKHECSLD